MLTLILLTYLKMGDVRSTAAIFKWQITVSLDSTISSCGSYKLITTNIEHIMCNIFIYFLFPYQIDLFE